MNIQEILSSRNIAKVIYIDDELNKESFYDNAIAKVHVLIEEGTRYEEFPFLSNPDIWEESFQTWWANATFEDVLEFSKAFGFPRTKTLIANQLHVVLHDSCPLELLAPEEFNDIFKDKLIQELSKENKYAIILVDYELNGYEINGEQLLGDIANCKNVFCGIFSQTFDISDEIEQWSKRKFPNNVYPISKKRFEAEDADNEIVKGIKNIIWLKYLEDIKQMANQLASSASQTLKDGLKEIDPATFDRLIISSSIVEGCWEFDLLSRIMQVYLNRGIKKEMQKMFADFQEKTNSIRNFHDYTQTEFVNDVLLTSFASEEFYDDINYINSIYCTIANGDIFLIKGKYFILLAQPCNLSIRGDGRRSYDLDQAFLVPLYGNEKHLGTFCEELQYPFNKTFCHVSFVDRQRVSLSILDLVSYNRNGEATIDIHINSENLPGHEIMQDNLLKRYNKIKDKISSIHQTYELALNGRNDKNTINLFSKYFCKPLMGGEKVAVKPKIEASKISFDIKRVGRYNSYGAHVLLQQFMSYMSRPEFPAKFDRC